MRKPTAQEAERLERERAKRRAEFFEKLRAAKTLADLLKMVAGAPGPDQAGRPLYSNLSFLLTSGKVPGGADDEEVTAYLATLQRLALTEDATKKMIPIVEAEIENRGLADR